MTTNITQVTIDLAMLAGGRSDPNELAKARRRASMTLLCVVGFVGGCTAGAVLEICFGLWALALPVVLEAILGFRLAGDTLRVDPCVPSGWPGYEVVYRHRSPTYRIRVENQAGTGHGVRSVTVDGRAAEGGAVPLRDDGREHDVRVTLG